MTCSEGRLYALVILAEPVSQPPNVRHSFSRSGPAALWITPSIPPPPRRDSLAALTIDVAAMSVMEALMMEILELRSDEGWNEVGALRVRPGAPFLYRSVKVGTEEIWMMFDILEEMFRLQ